MVVSQLRQCRSDDMRLLLPGHVAFEPLRVVVFILLSQLWLAEVVLVVCLL